MSSHNIVMYDHTSATIQPYFRLNRKTFPQPGAGSDEAVWGTLFLPWGCAEVMRLFWGKIE